MSRLLVAAIVGAGAGVILTRQILFNDFIRIWLVNTSWLLVWGGAVVVGVTVGLIAPRGRGSLRTGFQHLVGFGGRHRRIRDRAWLLFGE